MGRLKGTQDDFPLRCTATRPSATRTRPVSRSGVEGYIRARVLCSAGAEARLQAEATRIGLYDVKEHIQMGAQQPLRAAMDTRVCRRSWR